MNLIIDPEGGDLGRASGGTTRLEQIPFIVMRVGEVFSGLRHLIEHNRMFSYCFEVRSEYRNTLSFMLADMEREGLPKGCSFYETDGRKIFEIRGPSGGVVYSVCFYLLCKRD